MLLLYFRYRVFILKQNGRWEMLSITTVQDLDVYGTESRPQYDQDTARKGKIHFLAWNTNSGRPAHDFEYPLTIIRVLDPKFVFIMQVALCDSIHLTFCEDAGDSRRIKSVTKSETNARQNPYGSCAVECADTAHFYHLFHFKVGY